MMLEQPTTRDDAYSKITKLWFEVREANLGYKVVDTIEELFEIAALEDDMDKLREKHERECADLESDIERLKKRVKGLEQENDDLERRVEAAEDANT